MVLGFGCFPKKEINKPAQSLPGWPRKTGLFWASCYNTDWTNNIVQFRLSPHYTICLIPSAFTPESIRDMIYKILAYYINHIGITKLTKQMSPCAQKKGTRFVSSFCCNIFKTLFPDNVEAWLSMWANRVYTPDPIHPIRAECLCC